MIIKGYRPMKYNPKAGNHKGYPDRKSIRLKGYDYSQPGKYFITICTQYRKCLFGDIINGEMKLNDAGAMVEHEWIALPRRFPNIRLHEFIIMPNHFHSILEIVAPTVGPTNSSIVTPTNGETPSPKGKIVGDMVGAF